MSEFVAVAMSKKGGPCKDCNEHIAQGDAIYKYSVPKADVPARKQKNGPGEWVCFDCMTTREGLIQNELLF